MKRKILSALCACAILLCVSGCSENKGTSSSTAVSESSSTETSATESSADTTASTTENSAEESKVESEAEYVKYELGGEITPNMIADSRLVEGNKGRLKAVLNKLSNGEEVTVGFIGGSITQGTSAGSELCYAKLTHKAIAEMFPDAKVNYINAGIGATGSYIGVHRVNEDLLSSEPDLVFVEFSVNDTTENTARNKESYDSLLRTIWNSKKNPAIITIATTQENGTSFEEQHLEITKHYDIPMISYRRAILDVIKHGDIKWSDISDDDIHPNVPGHKIVSQLIMNYISDAAKDIDNIPEGESDFSKAYTNAGFENGTLLRPSSSAEIKAEGFNVKDGNFGGFEGLWYVKSDTDGKFGGAALTFEVEAKNIGMLFGKLTSKGGKAEVYVDDELVSTIDSAFPNGWGNYVECANLKSFDEKGRHTVKIVPVDSDSSNAFYVTALAIA